MHLPAVIVLSMIPSFAHAVTATGDEMHQMKAWAAAKLVGTQPPAPGDGSLTVLANNDVLQKNGRLGGALNIAGKEYRDGLFAHARSEVVVRLPAPGTRLEAVVGVDSNHQTIGGRGSVEFIVRADDAELFRSPVMRQGMPGMPVAVELDRAEEFTLEVTDGGDGIACDQADWAQAGVLLGDGRAIRLSDLPVIDPRLPPPDSAPPFSFVYAGKPSAELLPSWSVERAETALDECRVQRTLICRDPQTGLAVRCVSVEYRDFPVVEWTVFLRNDGTADTPLLEDIQALDRTTQRWAFPPAPGCEWSLHHFTGSPCTPEDYEPHVTELGEGASKRITAAGGRPTNTDLCYFNLEQPDSAGVIIGLGWPGQWSATFERTGQTGLHVRAGQELTRLVLHPGEEIRTPLVALLFWKGDWIRGQNLWRRWMVAHNVPRPGGSLPEPMLGACSSHQFGEMIHANDANQKLFVDRYLEEGIKLDYWWMDAGWYINDGSWPNTGTWEVDTKRFPGGLRSISDHARAKGVKTLVWFEPERVTPNTWLSNERQEWLLGDPGGTQLLNLGNPEARQWLTDHVDFVLNAQGIDLYRQDFNMDPLEYWRANDAPDRQGITEIRHVEGYLAYWDELRRRHPDMLIDSCASGGRRNDLETLRRAVPLLRSDWLLEPVSQQGHTYGIAHWYPYWGTGVNSSDAYLHRSVLCPWMILCYDVRREDVDYASVRRLFEQWREVAPDVMQGDYYPITSWSLAPDVWMAWQFDRPELGRGVVQVFRRAESIYEAARLRLRGLDGEARYEVRDLDAEGATELSGEELMDRGLPVAIDHRPGSRIYVYRKLD